MKNFVRTALSFMFAAAAVVLVGCSGMRDDIDDLKEQMKAAQIDITTINTAITNLEGAVNNGWMIKDYTTDAAKNTITLNMVKGMGANQQTQSLVFSQPVTIPQMSVVDGVLMIDKGDGKGPQALYSTEGLITDVKVFKGEDGHVYYQTSHLEKGVEVADAPVKVVDAAELMTADQKGMLISSITEENYGFKITLANGNEYTIGKAAWDTPSSVKVLGNVYCGYTQYVDYAINGDVPEADEYGYMILSVTPGSYELNPDDIALQFSAVGNTYDEGFYTKHTRAAGVEGLEIKTAFKANAAELTDAQKEFQGYAYERAFRDYIYNPAKDRYDYVQLDYTPANDEWVVVFTMTPDALDALSTYTESLIASSDYDKYGIVAVENDAEEIPGDAPKRGWEAYSYKLSANIYDVIINYKDEADKSWVAVRSSNTVEFWHNPVHADELVGDINLYGQTIYDEEDYVEGGDAHVTESGSWVADKTTAALPKSWKATEVGTDKAPYYSIVMNYDEMFDGYFTLEDGNWAGYATADFSYHAFNTFNQDRYFEVNLSRPVDNKNINDVQISARPRVGWSDVKYGDSKVADYAFYIYSNMYDPNVLGGLGDSIEYARYNVQMYKIAREYMANNSEYLIPNVDTLTYAFLMPDYKAETAAKELATNDYEDFNDDLVFSKEGGVSMVGMLKNFGYDIKSTDNYTVGLPQLYIGTLNNKSEAQDVIEMAPNDRDRKDKFTWTEVATYADNNGVRSFTSKDFDGHDAVILNAGVKSAAFVNVAGVDTDILKGLTNKSSYYALPTQNIVPGNYKLVYTVTLPATVLGERTFTITKTFEIVPADYQFVANTALVNADKVTVNADNLKYFNGAKLGDVVYLVPMGATSKEIKLADYVRDASFNGPSFKAYDPTMDVEAAFQYRYFDPAGNVNTFEDKTQNPLCQDSYNDLHAAGIYATMADVDGNRGETGVKAVTVDLTGNTYKAVAGKTGFEAYDYVPDVQRVHFGITYAGHQHINTWIVEPDDFGKFVDRRHRRSARPQVDLTYNRVEKVGTGDVCFAFVPEFLETVTPLTLNSNVADQNGWFVWSSGRTYDIDAWLKQVSFVHDGTAQTGINDIWSDPRIAKVEVFTKTGADEVHVSETLGTTVTNSLIVINEGTAPVEGTAGTHFSFNFNSKAISAWTNQSYTTAWATQKIWIGVTDIWGVYKETCVTIKIFNPVKTGTAYNETTSGEYKIVTLD